jgi:protein-S-isoprenylcysteine O-methyltransferase Ste14
VFIGVAFEERGLARTLGAPYEDYRRRVPAFLPRR